MRQSPLHAILRPYPNTPCVILTGRMTMLMVIQALQQRKS